MLNVFKVKLEIENSTFSGAPNTNGHQGHVPPQNFGLYIVKISKFCKKKIFILGVPPQNSRQFGATENGTYAF